MRAQRAVVQDLTESKSARRGANHYILLSLHPDSCRP
jgi:hypothetical protein